jgi:hypothetical protein
MRDACVAELHLTLLSLAVPFVRPHTPSSDLDGAVLTDQSMHTQINRPDGVCI